jgi:hypothetical protein
MELHLPNTESGFSRRPISPQALAAIDGVELMPGVPYVFALSEFLERPCPTTRCKRLSVQSRDEGLQTAPLRRWVATMTANTISNPRIGTAIT